jgi:predicted CoA-binding protein
VASYPIQGKYAFANWRNLGKKDLDFHQRGYHLIHVPPDKNNADLKMTSLGLSIAIQYPHIKEVFVCSSDRDLHHLSNSLLSHGLKVYRVFRQNDELTVSEINTARQYLYSLKETVEIMSLADCIIALKEIIHQVRQDSNSSWIQLAKLSTEFKNKYHLSLSQIVAHHCPEKKVRDIFFEHKNDFVVHQVDEKSEIYISLFDLTNHLISPEKENLCPSSIKDLTDWIYNFVAEHNQNDHNKSVYLSSISSQFYLKYAMPITQVTEKIGLGKHLPKALQAMDRLQLRMVNNNYQVSFQGMATAENCIIKSQEDFFKIVENLTKELLTKLEQPAINIGQVGTAFRKKYNYPITTIMSQLGLGKKLPHVFKYLSGLQLNRVDNNYFVSLKIE